MSTKKELRPENIIVGTDPVAIDIIQQIYSAIKDKNEIDRTVLERCWVLGIEKAYNSEVHKLDPKLCADLLERIYFHLEHKKIWEIEEDKLYELFEKIISLKTLKDSRIQEVFNNLETALTNVLRLDFSGKVALDHSLHDKRNIFNYMVFFFNTIIEKVATSMVSVKAINAFFSLYPETTLIITTTTGKVRFINEAGAKLLHVSAYEGFIGSEIKSFIGNYTKLILKLNKERNVMDFNTIVTFPGNSKEPVPVTISIPEMPENRSEVNEIVFVIKPKLI